jgi:hypothetical protein
MCLSAFYPIRIGMHNPLTRLLSLNVLPAFGREEKGRQEEKAASAAAPGCASLSFRVLPLVQPLLIEGGVHRFRHDCVILWAFFCSFTFFF